jgi:DNA topoisomerase-1
MAKNLVIVESPAKARTVGRFLGSKYKAMASMGHVRDLPKGKLGVKVDDLSFEPEYSIVKERKKSLNELIKAAQEADTVYLATDPDREGEAISWHLIEAAKINPAKTKRVVFHEITKDAVQQAFDSPRELDMHLIDAQQARRVLDRLVGYELSPVLWKKVRRGLSAGRVQSVAVRLVVEREAERNEFVTREYWTIDARFAKQVDAKASFKAKLKSLKGTKGDIELDNEKAAGEVTAALAGASYVIDSVATKERRRKPAAPFITSTMQQEASRKLRFTAARTMSVAQQLYEGLPLGDGDAEGLITYMRTDSTNVAKSALEETARFLKQEYGAEYTTAAPRAYTRKVKGAQEAHEAVRPTSIFNTPDKVKKYLSAEQNRLYKLVWNRMVASQMPDALFDQTTVDIAAETSSENVYMFRASGSVLKFPGHQALYMEGVDDNKEDEDGEVTLPKLVKADALDCTGLKSDQHFTEPPPRFTEATLIRLLEERGIGRPSTYAPTLGVIQARDYVRKEKGRFVPSKLGTAVNGLLTHHFPDTVDVGFTARVEEELDEIASGEREWVPVLREFYGPFHETVEKADREAERVPRSEIDEESDEVCEVCERPMVIKSGRFGRFLSCSGFPECKTSRPLVTKVGVACPECGHDIVEKKQRAKGGRRFYGCSNYPNCKFATNQRPLPLPCPDCKGMLLASGRDMARCTKCEYKGPVPESDDSEESEESEAEAVGASA